MKAAVAVFAKLPVPGKVKTRLAATVGPEAAAAAYRRMLSHVLDHILAPLPAPEYTVALFGDPFASLTDYRQHFSTYPFDVHLQEGNDLGQRLVTALRQLERNHGVVMAIGTDCVALQPSHVEQARRRLEAGDDLVLGPAEDGGYYLIAMRRVAPELFDGIAWSTETVLAQTVEAARKLGYRIGYLPTLPDIDTWEDWKRSGLAEG